jgi:hypothetical protein
LCTPIAGGREFPTGLEPTASRASERRSRSEPCHRV